MSSSPLFFELLGDPTPGFGLPHFFDDEFYLFLESFIPSMIPSPYDTTRINWLFDEAVRSFTSFAPVMSTSSTAQQVSAIESIDQANPKGIAKRAAKVERDKTIKAERRRNESERKRGDQAWDRFYSEKALWRKSFGEYRDGHFFLALIGRLWDAYFVYWRLFDRLASYAEVPCLRADGLLVFPGIFWAETSLYWVVEPIREDSTAEISWRQSTLLPFIFEDVWDRGPSSTDGESEQSVERCEELSAEMREGLCELGSYTSSEEGDPDYAWKSLVEEGLFGDFAHAD